MYKTNYISDVIVKLNFNLPFELKDNEILENFKKHLCIDNVELFPSPVNKFELNVADHSKHSFTLEGLQGIYKIGDSKSVFVLNPSFLRYNIKYSQSNPYINIETVNGEFSKGLVSLHNIYKDFDTNKFSIRFINKINLSEINKISDWRDYINNSYLSNYGDSFPDNLKSFTLRRKMNSTFLSNGEYMIKINLGIWNDFYPGRISSNEFIIDIECSLEFGIYTYEDLEGKLPGMSKIINSFFNDIITDKLKSKMEKIKDE